MNIKSERIYHSYKIMDTYQLSGNPDIVLSILKDSINTAKHELAKLDVDPSTISIEMEKDYSGCYYECDQPEEYLVLQGRTR